jgi:tRNA/rRNA methyltransferase
MANSGMRSLVLVNPKPLDMEEARMMACHAGHVLEGRRECATLAEAVADCTLVMGTSAREGLYRQHARSPREWAPVILDAAAQAPVALVFGREDKGLSNEELALCNRIIQIPSDPAYPSLNLSQAVLICCHELFLLAGNYQAPVEKSLPATSEQRERMFAIWRELLLEIGFMEPEKADHMMLGIRRLMGRGAQTDDDVRILMGIARQVEWAVRLNRRIHA